jgi:hypothetical protein
VGSDERQRRIAKNEALFRSVNEDLVDLETGVGLERLEVVCECGSPSCASNLHVSRAQYEAVRADPCRFLIVPGHQIEDVETVVEEHPEFAVVEKDSGEASRIVVESDPRG